MQNEFISKQLKLSFLSNLLMVFTSVHHIYGAVVYHTPGRLHVLFLSIPVLAVTLFLERQLQNPNHRRNLMAKAHWIIILIFSILLIGIYEGIYNHILKNIFFFGGLTGQAMETFFPGSIYVMPDNFFFELTGIGQGIIAILLINRFMKFTKTWTDSPA